MPTSTVKMEVPGATKITITEESLTADLIDGRIISVPIVWYPRLIHATPAERNNWILRPDGQHIHWPDLDEDISIEGMLAGWGSQESPRSLKQWQAAKREGRGLTLPDLAALQKERQPAG